MSTVYETIKNEYEGWKKKVTEDADLTGSDQDVEGLIVELLANHTIG